MTAAPASFADAQQPNDGRPILSVRNLRAHFRTSHFGINRYVKAVDGITFDVKRGEIYGLAGESSSGKTTLIKTIAAATQPPLEVLAGTITFNFPNGTIEMQRAGRDTLAAIRWRHLSYIMQGSMSVLNPVRRVRHAFVDF